MAEYTPFGLVVKQKLFCNHTQGWLCEQVEKDTGLKVDSAYMSKILTGQRQPPKIIDSICKILDIASPLNAGEKKGA